MALVFSYVRFSHKRQEGGDSVRRQNAMRTAWLDRHPQHTLDATLRLKDYGVSAFKGMNLDPEKGDLGKFIALAQQKDSPIPRGSILLLERMDRFSRQKVSKAYRAFCELVEAGVEVQTLDPEMTINSDNVDDMETVLPVIIYMQLAYEQSREKTKRIGAAWKAKRDKAQKGEIISRVCPTWLEWNEEAQRFDVKDEGRKALQFIFEQASEGIGQKQINYELNRRFHPLGRAKHWHTSFVGWILKNRQVIGEFQPSTRNDKGERVPEGKPIAGYYPRVISDNLFYQANAQRAARRKQRGPNEKFVNLFIGLVHCHDGHKMQIKTDRAKRVHQPPYVQRRFISQGHLAHLPKSCPLTVNYRDVEALVLDALTELSVKDFEMKKPDSAQLNDVVAAMVGVEARITELEDALVSSKRPVAALTKAIDELESKKEKLKAESDQLKQAESTAEDQPWVKAMSLVELLKNKSGQQDEHNIRLKLRGLIAMIVERITLAPFKEKGRVGSEVSLVLKSGVRVDMVFGQDREGYWSEDEKRMKAILTSYLNQARKAGVTVIDVRPKNER